MPNQTVVIAPIAARTGDGGTGNDGVYRTAARPLPAGTYKSVGLFMTFNAEATDFLPGDEVFAILETSFDGGATWDLQVQQPWKQGERGRNGLYYTQINNLVVPANAQYRGTAQVRPAAGAAASITFGVSASITT